MPEFGANGKDKIPVRWLLSHQVGLPVIDARLTLQEALAWDPVIRALEAQKPLLTDTAVAERCELVDELVTHQVFWNLIARRLALPARRTSHLAPRTQ